VSPPCDGKSVSGTEIMSSKDFLIHCVVSI
jgi:hypothetical protein